MKRAVWIAGALVALAVSARWAARSLPPTGVSGRPAPPRAAVPSPEARAALATLREILSSKNDNDPRLDGDFNALSPEAKELFRREYRLLPPERRNERGTIVYLLGKNPRDAEDWAFLREVAGEAPCLSLSDCSKKPLPGGGEEASGDEVTLAYPSLVALKQAQRALEKTSSDAGARGVLSAGRTSGAPAVARLAAVLERKFARP